MVGTAEHYGVPGDTGINGQYKGILWYTAGYWGLLLGTLQYVQLSQYPEVPCRSEYY